MKRILALVMLLTVLLGCMVTSASAAVAVKSVSLNKTNVNLAVGKTFQLKATISPSNASNKKVTFSSSNTKIATVSSSGLITAKSVGSCTITAKSNNNKKTTVTVKVTQPAVTSVKLDKTSINMLGKTVTLKATCQPSGSNQKVTWTSSNSKVATVSSSGVVTPKGYGSCTITAKSNNGKAATCSIYVRKDNTFSKSKVVSSGNAAIGKYTLTDSFTIVVDGLTGKIRAHDCYQTVTKTGMLAVVSVSNDMKVYNVSDTYIDVRSQYKLSYKGAIGTVTKLFGGDMSYVSAVFTRTYRIDNQGNVTITSYSEQR